MPIDFLHWRALPSITEALTDRDVGDIHFSQKRSLLYLYRALHGRLCKIV